MSFILYDISFLIAFSIFLVIFLVLRRKKIQREGILILYRTKLGIKVINYISKRYKKFLNAFEYVLIFSGYLLMIGIIILLIQVVYLFFKFPTLIQAIKIPPIAPLIPYLPQIFKADYLPPFYFTYWIIVLAITAIVHEFFHGIFAKARGIKIKSTGFAFLGPFTGAFVEPDENKVKKLKIKEQIGFLAAGSFSNLLLGILFFVILWLFFLLTFAPSGVIFNMYTFSIINTSNINITNQSLFVNYDGGLNLTKIISENQTYYIQNTTISNFTQIIAFEDTPALKSGLAGVIIEFNGEKINKEKDLQKALLNKKPGDNITVKTLLNGSIKEYNLALIARPDNSSQAYLGIATIKTESSSLMGKVKNSVLFFKDPNTRYTAKFDGDLIIFIYNLIWWIVFINFSVALGNMMPLGLFDGGRVFYLTMLWITKSEKFARKAYKLSTYLLIGVFLLLTFLWFINFF
jgi:membrane-associated protease RseP (regulator of RpoE activity)